MALYNQPYIPGDTIAAITTPLGQGGVGVVRISGAIAIDIANKVFTGDVASFVSHTAHWGRIVDLDGSPIDDVLLLVMRAPRSYTGEDTVEVSCHGGPLVCRRVLEAVLVAGARAARPGEFTFKAFINGKLDLSQAEAVQSLIAAKSDLALDAAENQLRGALSAKISSFQKELTDIAAILEAAVDFPEEDLAFASSEEIIERLKGTIASMKKLECTFHDGKLLSEGVSVCLIGAPNVGKSSLMNALLDKDRSIVSPEPGTTRDLVEDHLRYKGLAFRLIDTAGIRSSEERIELEGIRRTRLAIEDADIVLLVLDASRQVTQEEKDLLSSLRQDKVIVVWNKIDLTQKEPLTLNRPQVCLSALKRSGLEDLYNKIDEVVWEEGPPSKEEVIITSLRHKEALNEAIKACESVISGMVRGASPEFISMDMRLCLSELGKIIGTDVTEDILSSLFSKFCVGK